MKPEDLTHRVVEILNGKFHVIKAHNLDGVDWSLVGYWLDGDQEPETPHIQHMLAPPDFIKLVEVSSPA